jgi:drug/metabolite transporter (DMT)-like permease
MAGKIFINYRREDSIAIAGRLHDRLAATFGRDNLFMDVDDIPVGINFEEYLNNQVAQCDAMLSIVGPNWLNAKDETDQRRLDKPDDFVAIELAAALARNILVIPVLVDNTCMPKASELPASLKPLALRNAIHVRNTNFGSDAAQLITKMREALALGRPEQTQELVMVSFNATLAASFLLNIGLFLGALSMFFSLSQNSAGALAAIVAATPLFFVGLRDLARDKSVRWLGLVISIVGLLAVAAIIVSGQFFGVGLFDRIVQGWSVLTGVNFLVSAMVFGSDQYRKTGSLWPGKMNKISMIMVNSPWLAGLIFLCSPISVPTTWVIFYRLTDSVAAALALVGVQLLAVGYCYVRYHKVLAANPAPAPS